MSTPPLIGRQLVIRDWIGADLAPYEEWQQPGKKWQTLDGPYYPRPSVEETAERVANIARRIEKSAWPSPRVVLVVADRESDQLIGTVSRYWQSEESQWLSLGVGIFDETQWGRGLGMEALGLWSEYIFDALPELARLDLRTWSGNRGMMRVAEKLGYTEEARFRNARVVGGKHYDGMGYGVLREEWAERYPRGFAEWLRAAR